MRLTGSSTGSATSYGSGFMPDDRRTVTIPLDVPIGPNGPDAERQVEELVARSLEELAREGWVADQATDFHTLKASGQLVEVGQHLALAEREYFAVHVALKRAT